MKDGYIRAAAMTPKIKVADCVIIQSRLKNLSLKHMIIKLQL